MDGYLIITIHGGVLDFVMHTADEDKAHKVWRDFYRENGMELSDSDTPASTHGDDFFSHCDNDCFVYERSEVHHLDPLG